MLLGAKGVGVGGGGMGVGSSLTSLSSISTVSNVSPGVAGLLLGSRRVILGQHILAAHHLAEDGMQVVQPIGGGR